MRVDADTLVRAKQKIADLETKRAVAIRERETIIVEISELGINTSQDIGEALEQERLHLDSLSIGYNVDVKRKEAELERLLAEIEG